MSFLEFNYHNCIDINDKKNSGLLNQFLESNSDFQNFINSLPFIKIVNNEDDIEEIKKFASKFSNKIKNYCIVGTGGSSLGAQTLIGLLPDIEKNKFLFYDNIDPVFFQNSIKKQKLEQTGFIVISKSGFTIETLGQFGAILKVFEDFNLSSDIKNHFIVITENKESPLNTIAKKLNIPVLHHDKNIGGRFSVFSNVGLLPAYIAGIDIKELRNGGKYVLNKFKDQNYNEHIVGAALSILMKQNHNINLNVILTYSHSLIKFGMWYRQLWAESIGKKGLGTTPINFNGTVDQHSQIQLYLDGPKDKFFTFIKTDHLDKGLFMHHDILKDSGMQFIAGKKMGDLMEAEQNSTLQTLINKKLPTRVIFIKKINYKSLGALMMHFFLETITVAKMLKLNPFDQPAVEEGKILTKDFLSN